MKKLLRNLFRFVLQPLESGDAPYSYKPLNRKILLAVGVLFCVLGVVASWFAIGHGGLGYALPIVVFFGAGILCLVVGLLGTDRAVARIWGNR
jgi:hypothetical protein